MDNLRLGEANARLYSVGDEMIQAGYAFFHLNETLLAAVKLAEFLTDHVAAPEINDALVGLLAQRLQELHFFLENCFGISVHQPDLLHTLDVLFILLVDGLVHRVVALRNEAGNHVVVEQTAVPAYELYSFHLNNSIIELH